MASSEEDKKFWTALFEENSLTMQLPILADDKIDGVTLPSSHSGSVKVKVIRASALGDNFMSDTFLVKASAQDENSRNTFIKVIYKIFWHCSNM